MDVTKSDAKTLAQTPNSGETTLSISKIIRRCVRQHSFRLRQDIVRVGFASAVRNAATCCASTSFILKRSARIPPAPRCTKQSIGLLGRRHVAIDGFVLHRQRVESPRRSNGAKPADPTAAYTTFPDPRRDEWATKILPVLKAMLLTELVERSGLARSTLQRLSGPGEALLIRPRQRKVN